LVILVLIIISLVCHSPFCCAFLWYGALLQLHSFPTRRSSDLVAARGARSRRHAFHPEAHAQSRRLPVHPGRGARSGRPDRGAAVDRKSTRLNSSHVKISYAVFCLKKKNS